MEVLAEVVGEVTVHYLLPFLLDRVTERRDRDVSGLDVRVTRPRPEAASALRLVSAPPGIEVVSRAPGRVRARVAALRGNPGLAEDLVEALAARRGVHLIQASPTTGSVLVLHDPARAPVERLLRAIADVRASRGIEGRLARDDDALEVGLALVGG